MKIIKAYGPYKMRDGRSLVQIVSPETGKIRSLTVARMLAEHWIGRQLLPGETVDHIDRDRLNDSIDNLRVIDGNEHSKQDSRHVEPIKLVCCFCGKHYTRKPRLIRNRGASFCSHSCSGKALGHGIISTPTPLPVKENRHYFFNEKTGGIMLSTLPHPEPLHVEFYGTEKAFSSPHFSFSFQPPKPKTPKLKTQKLTNSNPNIEQKLCACGKQIKPSSKQCKDCYRLTQPTKIQWPDNEALKDMIHNTSMFAVSKKLGVTFNAVKKRVKKMVPREVVATSLYDS